MRLATIDLGTNTVRLLVADLAAGAGRWRVIEADQRVTRWGEGLAATGRLGEAPAERTAAAVGEYVTRARRAGAERVAIVATSAVREAGKRPRVCRSPRASHRRACDDRQRQRGGRPHAGRACSPASTRATARRWSSQSAAAARSTSWLATGRRSRRSACAWAWSTWPSGFPFRGPVDWPRYTAMQAEIRRPPRGRAARAQFARRRRLG